MKDRYALGETIQIRIRNNADTIYLFDWHPDCPDLRFYGSNELRVVHRSTPCDMIITGEIKPGDEAVLAVWRQSECIARDLSQCFAQCTVAPGRYGVLENFYTEGRQSEIVVQWTFVIGSSTDPPHRDQNNTRVCSGLNIPDDNLKAAIEEALNKRPGEEITVDELANVTTLEASDSGVVDLSGVQVLGNLREIVLWGNRIRDISPLLGNAGLGAGDVVFLQDNNLDLWEGSTDLKNIRALQSRGVLVAHDEIAPPPTPTPTSPPTD